MNFEFMTIGTPLPPVCLSQSVDRVSSQQHRKGHVLPDVGRYALQRQEDENGILFVCFPVTAIAAVLSRSPMTVKRSLNELETAGLIMRVRQGVGEPKQDLCADTGKGGRRPCLIPQSWKSSTGSWRESEKKLRKAINDEKALQHQLKQLTRKERTHRLCTVAVCWKVFCKSRNA